MGADRALGRTRERRTQGLRPARLLLAIAGPALAAGVGSGLLILPDHSSGVTAPTSTPPAKLPRVALDRPRRARRPAPPLGISIPSAGIQGPVDPVGEVGGALEIPPPGRAGWFRGGPRPGERGRAVVVSHVDSREGPALFAALRTLERGTRILVEDHRGGVHRFRTVRRRQVEKSRFAAGKVYGSASRAVLVLITCGGPFTPGQGYRDNVILYARAA